MGIPTHFRCEATSLDDTFQVYVNRVARLTLPEALHTQAQHIQASPKFNQREDGQFEVSSFPGYSVITPPWAQDPGNQVFYTRLRDIQQQLMAALPEQMIVPVPPETFHMTLADLIWDSTFRDASTDPKFEPHLRDRIGQIFERSQPALKSNTPAYWQMLGITLRTRAISVCLAPKDEDAYQKVVTLRRAIYQDHELMGLGIDQQYHLTAHITLGYFGTIPAELDRDAFSQTLNNVNLSLLDFGSLPPLELYRAELRKFEDMSTYYREPSWPAIEF